MLFKKYIERKAKEMLDNDSYIQEKVEIKRRYLESEIDYYGKLNEKLTELFSKYVKISMEIPPDSISREILIKYDLCANEQETIDFVITAMKQLIKKEFEMEKKR